MTANEDPGTIFIAEQIRAGDQDAWQGMATKIASYLRRSRNEQKLPQGCEPDDYQQEVLLRMNVDIHKMEIRSRNEFWGFVKRVADNTLVDIQRAALADKRGGGRERPADLANLGFDPEAPQAWSASNVARSREVEELEEDCLSALSRDESRKIYMLRRRQGLSYSEIASAVGRNKAVTVKVIYKRSRDIIVARLRERLDGYSTGLAHLK